MIGDLRERIERFKVLEISGPVWNPEVSKLVHDLWSEVRELRSALSQHCARTIQCSNPLECIKQIRSPVVDGVGWAEAAFDALVDGPGEKPQ